MLGLILAGQSALLLALHLGVLASARALGGRIAGGKGRALGALATAVGVGGALVAFVASSISGWAFFFLQLGVYVALTSASALDPERARAHVVVLQSALFALLLRFLLWRGLHDARGPTPVLEYVFQDFTAQLVLPAVGAVHERVFGPGEASFLEWLRAFVHHAASGVTRHVVLLGGTTTHLLAVLTVRVVTSRRVPAALSELAPAEGGVIGALALVAVATVVPSVSPLLRAAVVGAIVPSLVLEAVLAIDRYRGALRTGRLALFALVVVLPFTPALLHALATLGAFVALLAVPRSGPTEPASRAPLGAWAASGLAVLTAFGAIAAVSGYLVSPARGLPDDPSLCGATRVERGDADDVVVRPGGGLRAFRMDVDERPLATFAFDEAERACAEEGKRVCSSRELYVVCACDHGVDGHARALLPMPREGLVARASCEPPHPAGREPPCSSDHGVRDLLGGRSEISATSVAHDARLVAGANDGLRENWMVHCRWRSVITEEALERARYPMLGFRCCRDVE